MGRQRNLARILRLSFAVAVAAIAALVAGIWLLVDVDAYRAEIAAAIESATGRDVTIAGDVDLALLPRPRLAVGDIRLGNADWGSSPQMLQIGRLHARLDPLPLLTGDIVIDHVALGAIDLLLETDPEGRGNWSIGEPRTGDGAAPGRLPTISKLVFDDARITWRPGADGSQRVYRIDRLEVVGLGTGRPVAIAAHGTGAGPGAWSLGASVTPQGDSHLVDDVDIRSGDSDITGQLRLAATAATARLDGTLASRLLRSDDVSAMLAAITGADDATRAESAGRVFADTPLGIELPRTLAVDVRYDAERVDAAALTLRGLSGRVRIADQALSIAVDQADLRGGRVTAGLILDSAQRRPQLQLTLTGEGLPLARLLPTSHGAPWLESPADVDIRVHGAGRSAASIAADLSGTARLLVGKGRADLRAVDTLIGGLSTALATLGDGSREPAVLNCMAASFDVEQGIATSRLMLADTEHSTVYGEGNVDLRRERLDLLLRPKPKQASLSVAVPVRIGGTLLAPQFTPDKAAVARKGAGVLAAVGLISFPPAILLGLGELGSGDPNPCLDVAAGPSQTQAQARGNGSGRTKNLIERAADTAGATLDGIGNAVKGLFD
ncbi:MAG: AsmA family protein [Gammaproteobacteria bacterium]|nr:AsmA family protein [Gammaproteobacteria bacterium]